MDFCTTYCDDYGKRNFSGEEMEIDIPKHFDVEVEDDFKCNPETIEDLLDGIFSDQSQIKMQEKSRELYNLIFDKKCNRIPGTQKEREERDKIEKILEVAKDYHFHKHEILSWSVWE